MQVFALIIEARSDDERLIGIYASEAEAHAAYKGWEDWTIYPFYRVEERTVGAAARDWMGEVDAA